ncbi:MAG: hypothetical protein AB1505_17570 [Candidatus Latescibacterota bacterium]
MFTGVLKEGLLARVGLVSRQQLAREAARRERWHGLVRDVFARYYLKLREPFYSCLPPLPQRYTSEWEAQVRQDVEAFLALDLQPVAELLEVCGFGTPRWEQVCGLGFARLEAFLAQQLGDGNGQPCPADPEVQAALEAAREENRRLRVAGRRALEQLRAYEERLARLEAGPAPARLDGEGGAEGMVTPAAPCGDPEALRAALAEREATIEDLRRRLEQVSRFEPLLPAPATPAPPGPAAEPHGQERLEDLERKLRAREEMLAVLQGKVERLQQELEQTPGPAEDSLLAAGDLARQNAQLRGEVRAKEHAIAALRHQVEELEHAMESTRGELLDQVRRLGDLASGQIQLKPSAELERMGAEELLSYAQEVAGDVEVRRQTLDEGIQGVESLKSNYEESRRFYEAQQRTFQAQLEAVSAELEAYQRQQPPKEPADDNAATLIQAQRHQLDLLGARITELSNTNKNLSASNARIYKDMEAAVKRLVPLRRQLEELESLRDTLCRYIREKHDRTFTLRKLDGR